MREEFGSDFTLLSEVVRASRDSSHLNVVSHIIVDQGRLDRQSLYTSMSQLIDQHEGPPMALFPWLERFIS